MKTLEDRLLEKIRFSATSGCWLWEAAKNNRGYGLLWRDNKLECAHRVSYEYYREEIPSGLQLDHLCRVRHCVNPWHLETVTSKENTLRGVGPTAINSIMTVCINGHKFTDENTYSRLRHGGIQGQCKQCCLDRNSRFYVR